MRRPSFVLRRFDFDEFSARLGRNWIASIAAILDIKLDGLPDVVQRLVASITLADTSRQRRHADNVSAILFLLQNDRIAHQTLLINRASPLEGSAQDERSI